GDFVNAGAMLRGIKARVERAQAPTQEAGTRSREGGAETAPARRWLFLHSSGLDLRPFCVVARRLRDRSDLGLNRLENRAARTGSGPFLRVWGRLASKCV